MKMHARKPSSNGTLCIVEPDHAVRDALASFAGFYNEDVSSFSGGAGLCRAWPNLRVVGVLCAAQLADVRAVELYQWLRDRGLSAPFAITASAHQHREIASAQNAGIFHILHKPLLPGTALVRFLDHTRAVANNLCNQPRI